MLKNVTEVMDELSYRAEKRTDFTVDRIGQLGIKWKERDNSHTENGWYADIDGQDMILSSNAVSTASRMIQQANTQYWSQFPDKNAFPKTLEHILDRGKDNLFRVRHNGIKINAIVPFEYKLTNAVDLMDIFVSNVQSKYKNILGIEVLDDKDGDICSYKIVIGDNILQDLNPEYGQYIMFFLKTSETGACNSYTSTGLFRTICTNSAIGKKFSASWSHVKDMKTFVKRSASYINNLGYYSDQIKDIFKELLISKLEIPRNVLLNRLKDLSLISRQHYVNAARYINSQTEDGREIETQYDFFNLLTFAAQAIEEVNVRHQAEAKSFSLFTSPGGLYNQINNA